MSKPETTLRYIKQRSESDCGIASLAMACDMEYDDVANGLFIGNGLGMRVQEADGGKGINDDIVKAFLLFHGFRWQEMTLQVWVKDKFMERQPWPPSPFAPVHICFVEARKGWHYCVMNFDGSVRDPWKKERRSLSDPDYKRISSVIGIFDGRS